MLYDCSGSTTVAQPMNSDQITRLAAADHVQTVISFYSDPKYNTMG